MKKMLLIGALLVTFVLTIPTLAQSTTEPTFVGVLGKVEYYGDESAYGYLGAFAEVGEWAEVCLCWTLEPVHILVLPYNYSFYAARLVRAVIVELDYLGRDFYVSGLWDVYNVTFYYDKNGNFTWTIELLVDNGSGELNVIDNWRTFTVTIEGIDEIVGIVLRHCIRPLKPIPIGDVAGPRLAPDAPYVPDGEIDIFDLVHVAKAYGNTPGIGNYYFEIDFNSDYIVDIYDLTTLAANLGESY